MTRMRYITAIATVALTLAILVISQDSASATNFRGVTYYHTDARGVYLGGLGYTKVMTSPDEFPVVADRHIQIETTINNDKGFPKQYVQTEIKVWLHCADGVHWCNGQSSTKGFVEAYLLNTFVYDIGPVPAGDYYVQARYFWWNGASWTGSGDYQNVGIATVSDGICVAGAIPGRICS